MMRSCVTGLVSAYLADGVFDKAAEHLRAAVAHDGNYSAAWKLLGKAWWCQRSRRGDRGVPNRNNGRGSPGDAQAAKEMTVFLKRAIKQKG